MKKFFQKPLVLFLLAVILVVVFSFICNSNQHGKAASNTNIVTPQTNNTGYTVQLPNQYDQQVNTNTSTICPVCHGTGSCTICDGTGTYTRYGESHTCTACGGTGKCWNCGGTGKVG